MQTDTDPNAILHDLLAGDATYERLGIRIVYEPAGWGIFDDDGGVEEEGLEWPEVCDWLHRRWLEAGEVNDDVRPGGTVPA